MSRDYYKEPDVKYGRPKTKIAREPPPFFRTYDEEMKGWDARQFLRELVKLQGRCDWKRQRRKWNKKPLGWEGPPPWYSQGTPLFDLDEINKFLCRPPAVSQIDSTQNAEHALRLGMILIAVDPNTPDLAERLLTETTKIWQQHPLPVKKGRGRPSDSTNVAGIDANKVEEWCTHRIVALHLLRLNGYDPRKRRKQVAAWMFPEIEDQRKRGGKLDRAEKLLDEALAAARVIDAQTR